LQLLNKTIFFLAGEVVACGGLRGFMSDE